MLTCPSHTLFVSFRNRRAPGAFKDTESLKRTGTNCTRWEDEYMETRC